MVWKLTRHSEHFAWWERFPKTGRTITGVSIDAEGAKWCTSLWAKRNNDWKQLKKVCFATEKRAHDYAKEQRTRYK